MARPSSDGARNEYRAKLVTLTDRLVDIGLAPSVSGSRADSLVSVFVWNLPLQNTCEQQGEEAKGLIIGITGECAH